MENNIWESVPLGEKAPEVINVIVEIPKGSNNKYEFDEKLGLFKLDRVFYSPFFYPLDYGFIPRTRSEDGDHLDALVIGSDPVPLGTLVEARPIGVLRMIDSGDPDAKILCVQAKNPRFDTIRDIADVEKWQPHLLKEVAHFYGHYKDLQGKKVDVSAGWGGAAEAKDEIKKAAQSYTK
ncbi:MAG TPA: inorganic diphosphatase [Candidatus Paceibacterota bacterium]|nr:inorganic diphosphatase [Candidatus Paceibacterota bacterium]